MCYPKHSSVAAVLAPAVHGLVRAKLKNQEDENAGRTTASSYYRKNYGDAGVYQ